MTETTDTPETTATIPPLAESINKALVDLSAHACAHGQHEGRTGVDDKEMPECLADHVASLTTVLFDLTKRKYANSTIQTTYLQEANLADLPDDLIERVQKAVGSLAESLEQARA